MDDSITSNAKTEIEAFQRLSHRSQFAKRILKIIREKRSTSGPSRQAQYKFIALCHLTEDDNKYLLKQHLNVNHLRTTAVDTYDLEDQYLRTIGSYPQVELRKACIAAFQYSFLAGGRLCLGCPSCGKVTTSSESFPVFTDAHYQHVFYRFACCDEFFLIVGSSPQMRWGLYLPKDNIIISFLSYDDPIFKNYYNYDNFCRIIDRFMEYFNNNIILVDRYMAESKKKQAIISGFTQNVGHYVSDELSACDYLLECGKIMTAPSVIVGPYDHLDLMSIMPGFHVVRSISSRSFEEASAELFREVVGNGYCASRLTTKNVQSERLAGRIQDVARLKCSEDVLRMIAESKRGSPLLWITLRSHCRKWVSEEAGIAAVLGRLAADFPGLRVVFDGVAREEQGMKRIMKSLDGRVPFYSALRCSMYETITWAAAVDAFIAPFGAGSIFLSIVNKPGVVHAQEEFARTYGIDKPSCMNRRENSLLAIPVVGPSIGNGSDMFSRDYEVAWEGIYREICAIIRQRPCGSPGHDDSLRHVGEVARQEIVVSEHRMALDNKDAARQNVGGVAITLFCIPKPFTGHKDTIQRNAIESWLQLKATPEIILFGDEIGTSEVARECGVIHIEKCMRSRFGTPLLSDVFQQAQRQATHGILAYLNADILLMADFLPAIDLIRRQFAEFLVVGKRWDTDVQTRIDFTRPVWETELRSRAMASGHQHGPYGIDYFVFPRGLCYEMPPFAVGRPLWDNWLVGHCVSTGAAVIDASERITVIHQNHSYDGLPGGRQEAFYGLEAQRNRELSRGSLKLGTDDAPWRLSATGIEKRPRESSFANLSYGAIEVGKEALFLMKAGCFRKAFQKISMALEMEPTGPDLNYAQALVLVRLERTEEARTALYRELEVRPTHAAAKVLLKKIIYQTSRESGCDGGVILSYDQYQSAITQLMQHSFQIEGWDPPQMKPDQHGAQSVCLFVDSESDTSPHSWPSQVTVSESRSCADRVCAIIPTYNRGGMISRAIRSVQCQTHPVMEILVVDDGSSDNTEAVVTGLRSRDPRIQYIRLPHNQGAQAARNAGIRAAQSEWIAFLDSDDEWLGDKIERQLRVAKATRASVVHCECYIQRGRDGNPTVFGVPPYQGEAYIDVLGEPGPMFQGLLVERDCFPTIDYLDENVPSFQEWDTSIRLARQFSFAYVAEPLFVYHLHEGSRISADERRHWEGWSYVVNKHTSEIERCAGRHVLEAHYARLYAGFTKLGEAPRAASYYERLCCMLAEIEPGATDENNAGEQSRRESGTPDKVALHLCEIARRLMIQERFGIALISLDKAAVQSANIQGLQYARAVCLHRIGLSREAAVSIKAELKMCPGDPKCLQLLKEIQSGTRPKDAAGGKGGETVAPAKADDAAIRDQMAAFQKSRDFERQGYYQQHQDVPGLAQRFETAGVPVEKARIDLKDFQSWLREFSEMEGIYRHVGDGMIEKCLEHYIAFKWLNLSEKDVYIDIASSNSPWADFMRARKIPSYRLDLAYPKGIHGFDIGADAGATGLPDGFASALSLQCAFEVFRGDADMRFMKEAARILRPGGRLAIVPLYTDEKHFILSSPKVDLRDAPLDPGAIRVWREDRWEEAFSRHYSPEAFHQRIYSRLDGIRGQVVYLTNLPELEKAFPGQRLYCPFLFYAHKSGE